MVSVKAVPAVGVGVDRVKPCAARRVHVKLAGVVPEVAPVAPTVSVVRLGVVEGDRRRGDAVGEGERRRVGRGGVRRGR